MSNEEKPKPPKLKISNGVKSKKLPKVKLSGGKVKPTKVEKKPPRAKVARPSKVKTPTAKIKLPEKTNEETGKNKTKEVSPTSPEAKKTDREESSPVKPKVSSAKIKPEKKKQKELKKGKLATGSSPKLAKNLSDTQLKTAKHSTTARISIDEELLESNMAKTKDPDTVEVSPLPKGSVGKPKVSTSKVELPDGEDTTMEDAFNAPTLPMDTSEIRMAEIKDSKAAPPPKPAVPKKQTEELKKEEEGLKPLDEKSKDEELFKATTMPLSPADIERAEKDEKREEDLKPVDLSKDSDIFKATTMPLEPEEIIEAEKGDKTDDELFKATTIPMKSVENEEDEKRPKTVKIKKGPAVDSVPKTVKLKKGKETSKIKKDTTRIDLPQELASGSETTKPKKTVKLKRPTAPTKAGKPMDMGSPKPHSGPQPLEATGTDDNAPGTFFTILSLLSVLFTLVAIFYLNKALGVYNSF